MRTIIINKCYSSCVNYIHDIRELGFEPVLLEPYVENEEQRKAVRKDYEENYKLNGDVIPAVITEKESYEKTLGMIRAIDPVLILPGCDNGIRMALRLSEDLGLVSNSYGNYLKMRDKYYMQKALEEAGVDHIPTVILNTIDDALEFFRSQNGNPAVLKPTESSATDGVHICFSPEQVSDAYEKICSLINGRGNGDELLIGQPYVQGEEYAWDTVSCAGSHVALYGWKYAKRLIPGCGTVYDRTFYISPDDAEYKDLVDYVFNVLDVLGIKYGAVHTEVIKTAGGPVLVEVNCRPGGGEQRYSYQDLIMQEHETMVALHSYLMTPAEFLSRYPVRMHLKQFAAIKDICLKQDIFVKKAKIDEACRDLKSYVYSINPGDNRMYLKTTELCLRGGSVFFAGSDKDLVLKDLDYFTNLEEEHIDRLYDLEV